jgi:hypothetical protein
MTINEGLGRDREDDEYHVPDPVKHTFIHTVSKDGGEKHQRTVTTGLTSRPKHEFEHLARAHLEKQGYKIHEEVASNNVGDGKIAGTQGDAGKKSVMTKPLKRQVVQFKEFADATLEEKRGLWDNIHAKRKRIKNGSGERMRKPGEKGAPTASDFKAASEEVIIDDSAILEYAIDAKGHKSSTGGLTQKGVDAYNRKTGGNLQTAVTTPPSKLDPDSKAAKRRKSFCARMSGVDGPMKDEKGRPTRKALALRKWNC